MTGRRRQRRPGPARSEPRRARPPSRPVPPDARRPGHRELAHARPAAGSLERVGVETEDGIPGEPVTVAVVPDILMRSRCRARPSPHRSPPGGATSSSRPTSPRRSPGSTGYDQTLSVTPDTEMPPYRPSPLAVRDVVRETLAGAGPTEVVTAALVSPEHLELFRLPRAGHIRRRRPEPVRTPIVVRNPLSRDHSVLRQVDHRQPPPGRRDEPAARPLRRYLEIGKGQRPLWRRDARMVAPGPRSDGRGRAASWNRSPARTISTTPRAWSSCCAAVSGSACRDMRLRARSIFPPGPHDTSERGGSRE